ncbi:MAG: SpoIID/LytB domain-containing protein [Actinobacteria bacterium]|nr:SpoIID/LytB domain-containing protein [Actinomycetota bacterium]
MNRAKKNHNTISVVLIAAVMSTFLLVIPVEGSSGPAPDGLSRLSQYIPGGTGICATTVQDTIRVLMPDGSVQTMDMDEYLKGVVPSEIGASWPYDALCTQAIAARSYAATSYRHPEQEANVCTTTHCQAWSQARDERTDIAVESTHNMVALYNGEIISAYYFGHCDGHTRSSESVWGGYLPYCRSVSCPCGYTEMFGHGVGMCQQGVKVLAAAGWDYKDILSHYYTGVDVRSTDTYPMTWYFAEGTTRPGYTTYICLGNSNETAAEVDITYLIDGEESQVVPYTVEANSRKTIDASRDIGVHKDFSCTITSVNGVFIVAERPMYFNKSQINGGHDTIGANSPAANWYFAEGTTRKGYTTYLCIGNPHDTPAEIRIRYFIEGGENIEALHVVDPMSRETVNVSDDIGTGKDFSCEAASLNGVPVIVERPLYFNTGVYNGGHDAMGASKLKTSWYFAEGTTRPGYDTYVCLGNPSDRKTEIKLKYYLNGSETKEVYYSVEPLSRLTIDTSNDVGAGRDFSCRINTINSVPFIAERPMYFNTGVYNGGHDTMAAPYPKPFWHFAEGTARPGYKTYVCLGNPTEKTADVLIYYLRGNGTITSQRFDVPPYSRSTVCANDVIDNGEGPALDIGIEVTVVNRVGIFVERPMYFNGSGISGGHNTVGY